MHLFHSPFNISKEWLFFFIGYLAVTVGTILYTIFKNIIKRIPFRKTAKTTNFLIFICNLSITLGGLAISLYALGISEGIITMSASEKAQLASSINLYIYLVWMMFGIIVACIIIWILQFFRGDNGKYNERPIDMAKLNAAYRKRIKRKQRCKERKTKTTIILQRIKTRIIK